VALLMICASHAAFLAHVPCGLGVVFQHPARRVEAMIGWGPRVISGES
jgi:hypothetical protein